MSKIHFMKIRFPLLVLMTLLLSSCVTKSSIADNLVIQNGTSAGTLVVQNGTLFTANGQDPVPDGVVVMENGVIIALGPAADVTIPEGSTVIDAGGGTVMPGLIEGRASTLVNALDLKQGAISPIYLKVYLTNTLEAGITTLRAIGWDLNERPDLTPLREALAAQGNQVPTVIFAGAITHAEGNVFEIYPEDSVGVTSVEEAEQATQAIIESGAEQIILLQAINPDFRAPNTGDLKISLTPEQQTAIVAIAHEAGLQVLAQTSYPEDAMAAVTAGVDQLAVWPHYTEDPLPVDLIQALVEHEVPVLTGFSVGVVRPYEGDVRRFLDAGGTVIFGTFAPNSGSLSNPEREMGLMSLIGQMTPEEILMAATAHAAEAVGLSDLIGTLEVGKQADIIIVNGDPLEDISVMKEVVTVIKRGELVYPDVESEE